MNLRKLGRMLGVIAAVAILAMVLQGCGGDSDDGISQDMYDTLRTDYDAALELIGDEEDPAPESLRGQVAMLMGRADITPEDLQQLRDDLDTYMGRADITPPALQTLRDRVDTLMGRADITPEDLQQLRDDLKDVQDELADLKRDAADALAEAALKERLAREAGVKTAIETAENRVGTTANAFPTGITEQEATRDAAGAQGNRLNELRHLVSSE